MSYDADPEEYGYLGGPRDDPADSPVEATVSLDGITATTILDRDPDYPGTIRVRLQLDPPMGGISRDAYIAYPRVPGYA